MSTLTDLWSNLIKSFGSNPIPFGNKVTVTTPEITDSSDTVATTNYVQSNLQSYAPSKLIQTGTCPDSGDSTDIKWQIIDGIMTLTWNEANIYNGKVISFGKSFGDTNLNLFYTLTTVGSGDGGWIQAPIYTETNITIYCRYQQSSSAGTISSGSGWSASLTITGAAPTMVSAVDPNISINDSTTVDSLSTAVLNVASPVGIPHPWPTDTAPAGWLLLDGSQFNTSQYPLLATVHPSGILPDLRGLFIRGYDSTGTVDMDGATRGLLSTQEASALWADNSSAVANFCGVTSTSYTDELGWEQSNTAPSSTTVPVRWLRSSNLENPSLTSIYRVRPKNISYNYIVRAA